MAVLTVHLRYQLSGDFPEVMKSPAFFFADERAALAAGYRPCGNCLRKQYQEYMDNPQKYREKFGL